MRGLDYLSEDELVKSRQFGTKASDKQAGTKVKDKEELFDCWLGKQVVEDVQTAC